MANQISRMFTRWSGNAVFELPVVGVRASPPVPKLWVAKVFSIASLTASSSESKSDPSEYWQFRCVELDMIANVAGLRI